MKKKVTSLVLRTAGVNCDAETVRALKAAGADKIDLHHINVLKNKSKLLKKYDLIILPGGFSYGDTVSAGKILANEIKFIFKEEIKKFLKRGKLIIGICNGFQILVKSGILSNNKSFQQSYSLIHNDSKKFESRWINLKINKKSFWTKNLPDTISLPIAHGEGKFVTDTKTALNILKTDNQIIFQYADNTGNEKNDKYPINPNGSYLNIAGITDKSGQILGLMPHPERFTDLHHHPYWNSLIVNNKTIFPHGLQIFKNAIKKLKK